MTAGPPVIDHPHETVEPIGLGTCVRAVAQSIVGAVHPRRPTAHDLAAVSDAHLPRATTTVTVRALAQIPRLLRAGTVAEGVRGGPLRIGLRTYVVEHPRARMLLDPAVCVAVRRRALAPMPGILRRAVTPPADVLSTVQALHMAGLTEPDFGFALPTHLHWDHVCGLLDLPGLAVLTFPRSHDLFGDGSVVLLDLAGHTLGSMGVLLHTDDGWVLFAGDAAWHSRQVDLGAQ